MSKAWPSLELQVMNQAGVRTERTEKVWFNFGLDRVHWASVNKHSLREEFEGLKGRFAQLCTDGKITAESRALIEALLMLLRILRVRLH